MPASCYLWYFICYMYFTAEKNRKKVFWCIQSYFWYIVSSSYLIEICDKFFNIVLKFHPKYLQYYINFQDFQMCLYPTQS